MSAIENTFFIVVLGWYVVRLYATFYSFHNAVVSINVDYENSLYNKHSFLEILFTSLFYINQT